MTHDWQKHLQPRGLAATAFVPPPAIEETEWDILLALHSDRHCQLSLGKLARIVSSSHSGLYRWLERLEERRLITGFEHPTQELRAVLTPSGRELLDRYLSATSDLRVGAHH